MSIIGVFVLALTLLLAGCSTTSIADYYANAAPLKHRKLVVVIDGTGNDPRDHTNAFRLHELIANQNRDDIATFYTEGVGSHDRIIGMAAGMGMARDVRDAYRFLAERWLPGDEIYIIGFSRGAYAGRILQGMIYTAGIVDLPPGSTKLSERQKIVDRLYDANKMYRTKEEQKGKRELAVQARRQKRVMTVLEAFKLEKRIARIRAAAYWDTVAAMGLPDNDTDPETEDLALPYLDQFCNVDHVFHALSLDDNRPKDFTPIPATGGNRLAMCESVEKAATFDEVWFSGAHADLGGTYIVGDAIDGYLAGVSLNWMLSRLAAFDLTPPGASTYGNWRDVIHDARNFVVVYKIHADDSRDVFGIDRTSEYNGGVPRVHFTVEDRLKRLYTLPALNSQCSQDRTPKILCRVWIERSKFMRDLKKKREAKDDCLVPVIDPTSSRQTGWRFANPQRGVTELEIKTECVVVVYDTPEQRKAALPESRL